MYTHGLERGNDDYYLTLDDRPLGDLFASREPIVVSEKIYRAIANLCYPDSTDFFEVLLRNASLSEVGCAMAIMLPQILEVLSDSEEAEYLKQPPVDRKLPPLPVDRVPNVDVFAAYVFGTVVSQRFVDAIQESGGVNFRFVSIA